MKFSSTSEGRTPGTTSPATSRKPWTGTASMRSRTPGSRPAKRSQQHSTLRSPRWCLDELVQIMECKDSHGQIVMQVFVQKVEPTHVRKQTGTFGDGFERLIRGAQYADRKASWERALKQAADLAGLASDQMPEGEIVKKLINRVQSVLSKMSSVDLDKRFIVMKHVEIVQSSMFGSEQQWRCLGLWGMGGVGKTTLAKEIQKRVSNQFEGSCFVEKVGELAERGELDDVYWTRMSQLLKMNDANQDVPSIRRKLRITKVLIVLDDVSDADQCPELIENWESHCPGSKMIAISRDKQILKNIGCDQIYEVKALDDHESLQLLKHHILKKREPTPDQVELLKDAIKYTGGLPLALVVLGRNLFDKDITIWKSELAKLGDKPNLRIMKILKASFDGLDEDEKNIFLDIACVMEGWYKYDVERILDACGFHAISGIDRLVDKALLTIAYCKIQMHDLLRQMGKHIAAGSRLFGEKEIADILTRRSQGGKMERKIEVMSMEVTGDTRMELGPGAFNEMKRLRILRFISYRMFEVMSMRDNYGISFKEGLKYLPNRLRYLEWDLYPQPSLPPRFNPVNIVELRMRGSNLRQLCTGDIEKYTHFQPVELDLSQIDISKNYDRHRMHMMFMNCFSLGKEARNVIWRDLRLRNQSIIMPLLERWCYESWKNYSVGACTAGNEVPEWFKYSESGSRIQVNSKRLLLCPSGLYFFVVLPFPTNCYSAIRRTTLTCKGYSESGQPFVSSCRFDLSFYDFKIEHTIVWYHHLGSHNNRFYLNGSKFLFSASWSILKCGVTPFYNNDHEGDNNHGNGDGNNDDEDVDYNNNVRQRGSSSSILLAEEEPGGACGLDLNFHVPAEEGQGASGFDLHFSAPMEGELHLDLGFAPPAEEKASLVDRSQKRKREHDQEEESRSHKRNS